MVSWFNSWAANLPWTCHAENTSAWRACQSQKWKENRKSAENTKRKCKVQKKKQNKYENMWKKVERKKMKKNRKEFQKDVLPSKAQGETTEQWKHKIWPDSVSFQWPWHPCGTSAPAWTLVILVHFLVKPEGFFPFHPFSRSLSIIFLPTSRNTKRLRIFQHLLVVFQAIHLIQFGLVIESGPGREEPHSAVKLWIKGSRLRHDSCPLVFTRVHSCSTTL